jgi:hypothetical protein
MRGPQQFGCAADHDRVGIFPRVSFFLLRGPLVRNHSIALHQAGREHPLVTRVFSATPQRRIVSRRCDGFA